jgi:hypothetical protein
VSIGCTQTKRHAPVGGELSEDTPVTGHQAEHPGGQELEPISEASAAT